MWKLNVQKYNIIRNVSNNVVQHRLSENSMYLMWKIIARNIFVIYGILWRYSEGNCWISIFYMWPSLSLSLSLPPSIPPCQLLVTLSVRCSPTLSLGVLYLESVYRRIFLRTSLSLQPALSALTHSLVLESKSSGYVVFNLVIWWIWQRLPNWKFANLT